MVRYTFYLPQLGFQTLIVVDRIVQNYERDNYIKNKQDYTKTQKTQNTKQKKNTKYN